MTPNRPNHIPPRRSRAACAAAFAVTLAAGYLSRKMSLFPAALGKYPGDALWALMVYWLIVWIRPAVSPAKAALIAFAISAGVEFLKLAQAPWLVAARHSTFGALFFGRVFTWNNLIAYAVGVGIGASLESIIRIRRQTDEP